MRAKLAVSLGMVLVMAVAVVTPASAQPGISEPLQEVVATGVIRELDFVCNECARHAITDEATGADYGLVSDPRAPTGGVDLSAFVGQRVTIRGLPQLISTGDPNLLAVTRLEPAPAPPGGGTLPGTGGPSLFLVPIVVSILGGGIVGGAVLRRRSR